MKPRPFATRGLGAALWNALVAAGPHGCTLEDLADAGYPHGRPIAYEASIRCQMQRIISAKSREDITVRRMTDAPVLAWLIDSDSHRVSAVPVAVPVAAAVEPARTPASHPPRIGKVLQHLSGAPASVYSAGARTCRWPIGHPGDADFRYCSALVETPTIRGSDGHARLQPYCEACRVNARMPRQVVTFKPPILANNDPRRRATGAASLRFGRGS